MRNYNNTNSNRRSRRDKKVPWQFNSCGFMEFTVEGFVQGFKENERLRLDYVEFRIDDPCEEDLTHMISVSVPWDLAELNDGDYVRINGFLRSYWNADCRKVTYSFEAQYCDKKEPPEE